MRIGRRLLYWIYDYKQSNEPKILRSVTRPISRNTWFNKFQEKLFALEHYYIYSFCLSFQQFSGYHCIYCKYIYIYINVSFNNFVRILFWLIILYKSFLCSVNVISLFRLNFTGPNFFSGPRVTPRKFYGWLNFQKCASNKIRFLQIKKKSTKLFLIKSPNLVFVF